MGEKITAYRVQVTKLVGNETLPKRTRRWGDNTVKPALNGHPIYRKPGQTENKFRNGVISHVE